VSGRGSVGFLSAREWEGFEAMPEVLRRAGLPVAEVAGRAPWRVRMQAYGLALDILLVLDALAVTLALAVALHL
jgi:hypothetical protein